ncbi:BON domain-containing protein [bacterium]|nr:BON domain-containing protein [bacterium]
MIVQSPVKQCQSTAKDNVLRSVQKRLDKCHHGFIFRKVVAKFEDETLKLTGCVPSFYLKQNLQELLRDVPGVKQIINEVDVISSCGLSSVRKGYQSPK